MIDTLFSSRAGYRVQEYSIGKERRILDGNHWELIHGFGVLVLVLDCILDYGWSAVVVLHCI